MARDGRLSGLGESSDAISLVHLSYSFSTISFLDLDRDLEWMDGEMVRSGIMELYW